MKSKPKMAIPPTSPNARAAGGTTASCSGNVWVYVALLILVAAGAWFRLARLGEPALHMDNQDFLTPCIRGYSPAYIFRHWGADVGTGANHLPFPVAITQLFLQTFHLPLTFGTLMFPNAFWGILMIPAAFGAGRALRGPRLGLVLAALVAVNPIYIQFSRLAYYYAPALLGAVLSLWAMLLFFRIITESRLPRSFYAVNSLSVFFLIYSDSSAWPFAFLVLLMFVGYLTYQRVRHKRFGRELLAVCALYGVLGAPVLFSSWGLANVYRNTVGYTPQEAEYWHQVFWNRVSPWPLVWPVLRSFAWGTTPLRTVFSVVVLLAGVAGALAQFRRDRRPVFLIGVMLVGLLSTMTALMQTIAGFSHARLLTISPILLLLLALGLTSPVALLGARPRGRVAAPWITATLLICALSLSLWPAYLCTRQTGRPAPYRAMSAWLDANLPVDSPVLTERFFDAYNEFRIHPGTNVIFMSTVRNQSAPEYLGNGFRERSQVFLQNNPVSGFCQSRLLWDHPQVGRWTWPDEFFARRIVFTNEAGLTLHRLGLNDQSIPGNPAYELGFMKTVLCNLPEDVVARARRNGQSVVGFFGPGWKYAKTQDSRDWRVLGETAIVEANNLTPSNLSCQLVVRGVAVNGAKVIRISCGGEGKFAEQQLSDYTLGPFTLPPGSTHIQVKDPYWNTRQVPLFVESIACRPIASGSPQRQ